MAESQARKAWLVRWEWAGDRAAVEEPVAAILSPRLGGEQVRRAVEMLYASASYSPDEMLRAAQQHGSFNPYPAEFATVSVKVNGQTARVRWEGEITCGHNPWLTARKARVWPLRDYSGGVGWVDDERPAVARGTAPGVPEGPSVPGVQSERVFAHDE
ncbi:MAG TPA: hypothetical protein VES65_07935 [Solirubrobacteraceae bacterium]|nr:hypothetical protein [Solirubrobacteraceae bacterium]